MHLIVLPLTDVLSLVGPIIGALTIDIVLVEVALEARAVSPQEFTETF